MSLSDYMVPVMHKANIICMDCQRNICDCPWLRSGEPVGGWDAEPVILQSYSSRKGRGRHETYKIKGCPLFIRPSAERIGKIKRYS